MDDAIYRFRGKYQSKTIYYKVPERSRLWYVRRVGVFINARSARKPALLSAQDVVE